MSSDNKLTDEKLTLYDYQKFLHRTGEDTTVWCLSPGEGLEISRQITEVLDIMEALAVILDSHILEGTRPLMCDTMQYTLNNRTKSVAVSDILDRANAIIKQRESQ